MTISSNAWFWVGCYLLVGIVVRCFWGATAQAQELFDKAEEVHPVGWMLVTAIVAVLWPLVVIGHIRRSLRKIFHPKVVYPLEIQGRFCEKDGGIFIVTKEDTKTARVSEDGHLFAHCEQCGQGLDVHGLKMKGRQSEKR